MSSPAGGTPSRRRKRVIATGIQDNDARSVPGRLHLVENGVDTDRLSSQRPLGPNLLVDGHEIVRPLGLHAVSRIVEEARAAVPGERLTKLKNRLVHAVETPRATGMRRGRDASQPRVVLCRPP